ncbi:MAG: phosphodiester glycosidase family protein [Clostridia bacterium]
MSLKPIRFLFSLALCFLLLGNGAMAEIKPLPIDQGGGYQVDQANMPGKEEYKDESIHVTTERLVYNQTKCFVVRIKIADPSQLRTAMTRDSYDTKEYVQVKLLSKKKSSVLALNGDFFKYNDFGYLMRQGTLYRDRADGIHDVLLIDENADFHTLTAPTGEAVHAAVAELEAAGHKVINSFNFGPTLIENGKPVDKLNISLYQGRYPMMRLAIGQLGPLEYAVYFCYGTSDATEGLTFDTFTKFILKSTPEVQTAYNLDGGGSAHVLLLQTQLHTNPSGRDICDLIYFASASDLIGKRAQ